MKVEIKSNINFCLDNRTPKYVTYKVSGEWGINYNTNRITWLRDNFGIGTINGDIFYKLCQDIQGSRYEEIISILQSKEIRIENKEYSIQELDIIKSLANVFLWAEYFLLDEYDVEKEDFLPKLFDDFTIDINNKPTTQKDIYFLPKKYLDPTYSTLISNLMDINLLSELTVVTTNKTVKNHFIPLTKPGYKKDVFRDTDTLQFWKTILNDRHNALNKFFNQR